MSSNKGKQSADVAQQTQRRILVAAGRHFAAAGFAGASLREIADSAGTTHGLIRHHFGSKDTLWQAVVDDFIDQIVARHQPLLARMSDEDPAALLRAIATNYIRQSAEMPEVTKLMVKDCSEPGPRLDYLLARIRPVHDAITPVFERAHAAGHVQNHDPDSFFLFLVLLGSLPFALADFASAFSDDDVRAERSIETHVRRVLATLFGDRM